MTLDADDQVIVVGSGPCGATAAARLVERGVRVVMLDAGLRAPRPAGSRRWQDAVATKRVGRVLAASPRSRDGRKTWSGLLASHSVACRTIGQPRSRGMRLLTSPTVLGSTNDSSGR